MALSEQLRRAIRQSKKSHGQLARETGIPQPTISRFVAGADMKLSTADKLASYLGLKLRK